MSFIGNSPVVNTARLVQEVTATQGQTTFYPAGGYTVGQLDVEVNGISLPSGDYTATDGVSVVLAKACGLNDVVRFVAFGTFNVANTYTQAQVDTKISTVTQGFRNRIINGDMRIDQRNAGATITPSDGQFIVDRWKARLTQASKFSAAKSNTSVSTFPNSLLATSLSAYTPISTDYFFLAQVIEGFNIADLAWGTANAQSVTLSFWVRSSLTGTFGGCVRTQASGNANYPFTFTINAANTFEYKTVTISGPTSGNWNTDNNGGIEVDFSLGMGTGRTGTANVWDYSVGYLAPTGAVNLVATNGATLFVTGVQLEAGSVATPFERRPYGTELALCQRYYETVGGGGVGSTSTVASAVNMCWRFNVAKRATPSISHLANYTVIWPGSTTFTVSATSLQFSSTTGFTAIVTVSPAPGSTGAALCYYSNGDAVAASAEL